MDYLEMRSEYLEHYGVPGMKWKNRKGDGNPLLFHKTPAVRRRDPDAKRVHPENHDEHLRIKARGREIINKAVGRSDPKEAHRVDPKAMADQIYNSKSEERKRQKRAQELRKAYIETNRKIHRGR